MDKETQGNNQRPTAIHQYLTRHTPPPSSSRDPCPPIPHFPRFLASLQLLGTVLAHGWVRASSIAFCRYVFRHTEGRRRFLGRRVGHALFTVRRVARVEEGAGHARHRDDAGMEWLNVFKMQSSTKLEKKTVFSIALEALPVRMRIF